MQILPLFPLSVVTFPGVTLPLRLFEPRYLRMLSQVLRGEGCFVSSLLLAGEEASPNGQRFAAVGCKLKVLDFHELNEGLLHISVQGVERVRLRHWWVERDGLWMGEVEPWLEPEIPLLEEHQYLYELWQALYSHPLLLNANTAPLSQPAIAQVDSATMLSWQLSSCLPLSADSQLGLLSAECTSTRLNMLHAWLERGDDE
ncbi:LON peptidase substrate-binding domain-containing protein [Balneatrix alpica]|uniref:LON peptidase substrate-binding domain-containing protein n=1 Tax=Balneatrix alpica TaxID=75684 RepID=A0ABV5ZG64_9GAMM|nr:LON peptidase substrate-binding domain-containing protein [Balneatrix alpica]